MVKKKKLDSFFNKRWKGISGNLNDLCKRWDTEKLHDLRVHIKKIKAITALVKACKKTKKKSFSIKPIKEFYQHTGTIRTAELALATFTEYGVPDKGLEEAQQHIIAREAEALCKRKKTYYKDSKKLEKRFSKNLTAIKNKNILSYYQDSLHTLSGNFILPIKEEQLHDNRKIIKNLMYGLKVLPASLVRQLNIDKDYINNLQDQIGKWHDDILTLELLSGNESKNDKSLCELQSRKEHLFEAITQLAADFDQKVVRNKPATLAL